MTEAVGRLGAARLGCGGGLIERFETNPRNGARRLADEAN